ncbi:hypothetical protein C0991_009241 [Blastosporella zonata]|nr:hypothetical protein C0991_009241 [Blastosporella zonata]
MRLNGSSRPRNAPPDYSSLPTDHYVSKGDTKKVSLHVSPPLPNYKGEEKLAYDIPHIDQKRMVKEHQPYPPPVNIQPDFRINTPGPRHHQQSNPRLPPRMQALQMQIPRTDEKHRRSPRPPNAALEYAGPPSGNGAMQTGNRRRSHTPQMVDHNQPLFIDNNGFPASAPPPPSFDILRSIRDPIHPSAVSQPLQGYDQGPPPTRSIHNSSKSTNSGMSRGAPPPHHLPKHLVMPAPLQVSQPSAPQHRPQLSAGAHYLDTHSWQPQLRPPSPPIVPSALDPYIESQLRAEDMQMSQQSRKLRKRSSAQAIPLPPISQPLAFQTQKKLLSKRKTDFF